MCKPISYCPVQPLNNTLDIMHLMDVMIGLQILHTSLTFRSTMHCYVSFHVVGVKKYQVADDIMCMFARRTHNNELRLKTL